MQFETALGKVLMLYSLRDQEVREDFEFYKNAILTRVGAKEPTDLKFLGQGMNGYVFWLPDKKRVLKLTVDEGDANASEVIRKKPDRNLIKVHDVFTFGLPHWRQSWGIVSEKLRPLSRSEEESWRWIVQMSTGQYRKFWAPRMDALDQKWVDAIDAWTTSDDAKYIPGLVEAIEEHHHTLETWAKLLKNRGIIWGDLNLGNIMHRGAVPLISDVGGGYAPSQHLPQLTPED